MTTRTINYHIWPRDLAFDELLLSLRAFAHKRGLKNADSSFFQLSIDAFEDYDRGSLEDIAEVLQRVRTFRRLHARHRYLHPEHKGRVVEFELRADVEAIELSVRSDDPDLRDAALEEARARFNLRNPSPPPPDPQRPKNLHATVFLGRHFDEEAKRAADKIDRFLKLIGFEVLDGEEYNAQPIPEKVRARIRGQDIYIGLVTGKREHDWIAAEAAYALGERKHIILLVEEASEFRATITGNDREQIRFPSGVVEASFIKLLEEFRSAGVSGLL
jgi:hypothetical protein